VDIVKQIEIYTELGRSNRTGDSSKALNQMYGITFGRVPGWRFVPMLTIRASTARLDQVPIGPPASLAA
jgi:hypothetical protein